MSVLVADTDDDSYRPSKRSRADRPPRRRVHNDTDNGLQSSPGRSQPVNSRDDVPMTDQTDDYADEVMETCSLMFSNAIYVI